jgi:hypothetical protein
MESTVIFSAAFLVLEIIGLLVIFINLRAISQGGKEKKKIYIPYLVKYRRILSEWIDFNLWAAYQLEDLQIKNYQEVFWECVRFHREAEKHLHDFKEEVERTISEMRERGDSSEEIQRYSVSGMPTLFALEKAWRSLPPQYAVLAAEQKAQLLRGSHGSATRETSIPEVW